MRRARLAPDPPRLPPRSDLHPPPDPDRARSAVQPRGWRPQPQRAAVRLPIAEIRRARYGHGGQQQNRRPVATADCALVRASIAMKTTDLYGDSAPAMLRTWQNQ